MTQNRSTNNIWIGIISILSLNILLSIFSLIFGILLQSLALFLFPFSIGLAQLLYVLPLVIWCIGQQYWEFMKGAMIAATITALLNVAIGYYFSLSS